MTEHDPLEQTLARMSETFDGLDDSERLDVAAQTCEHLSALLAEIDAGRLDASALVVGQLRGAVLALTSVTHGR